MQVHGYKDGSISITLEGIRMDVPDDMTNGHRQWIAAWEALGKTIPEYVPPALDAVAALAVTPDDETRVRITKDI